jgi:hypothetical protein
MVALEKVKLMNTEEQYFELAELAYLVIDGKAPAKVFLTRKKELENKLE